MGRQPLALLFDIDGTLIDSAGAGGRALLNALESQFNLSQTTPVPLHGRTDLGIMTELLENHGIEATPEALMQLCDTYFQMLPLELERRGGHVLPGVVELLDAVSDMDGAFLQAENACHEVVLGVLTGNMPISAQVKLEHFRLASYFEFGVYGDRVHHRPDLRDTAISAVQQRCGPIAADRMVVIGDTPLDIALARAMGARCLAVCTGGIDAHSLACAGADHVVQDLSATTDIVDWLTSNAKIN